MSPAALSRPSTAHSSRILIAALAALLFVALTVAAPAANAQEAPATEEQTLPDDAIEEANPSIDIEKVTNGHDADEAPGPTVRVTAPVTWTYTVTNTGNVPLTNVTVSDDNIDGAPLVCPGDTLAPEESMECTASSVSWGLRRLTTHSNLASVVATFEEQVVADEDRSHYRPTLFCPVPSDSSSIVIPIYAADTTGYGGFMLGNGLSPATVGPLAVVIPSGTYELSLASYDAHSVKGGQYQSEEQYRLVFDGGAAVSSSTPDLAAGDDLAWWRVDSELVLPNDVSSILVEHTGPSDKINSLHALCAVFDPVELPEPGIDIEKATNGLDADDPSGPEITVGDEATWTYVVTNTGNVALADVGVTDDQLGAICTIDQLAVGASETCTKTGIAELGQYTNLGTAVGTYEESTVTDKDPSHYFGVAPQSPLIGVVKSVEPGIIPVGEATEVTWTIVVSNTGNVPLSDVVITDALVASCDLTIGDLAVAASATRTCTSSHNPDSLSWTFTNVAVATGVGPDGTPVTANDDAELAPIEVLGTAQLGDTVWQDTNKNGIQDSGEPGINGARVVLTNAEGTVVGTATTAKGPWDGWYKFVGLDAGRYTATLDTTSVSGALTTAGAFTIDLAEGQEYLLADFGVAETLPKTGTDSGILAWLGIGLLVLGGLAIVATRRRGFEQE